MSERTSESVDYYDPHARVTLEEPVALVGCPGARVAHTGHALASLTGLPLVAPQNPRAGRAVASLRLTLRCLADGVTFTQLAPDRLRVLTV